MRVFCIAVTIFAVGFMLHWLWWRVKIPARQTAVLLTTFSGTIFAALVLLSIGAADGEARFWELRNSWEVAHVASFCVAAMLAYVVAYSALEERSPSMTILTRVADSRQRGQSREELQAMLLDVSPVEIRLSAMLRDGMVREEAGSVVLTPKGWAWANTFSAWRRLLRFSLGG
jgi:magnesium-transporting ATPase (P-type)